MHRGKCADKASTLRADMSAPGTPVSELYEASGVMKFLDRWSSIGVSRSSSSRRGRARAVSLDGGLVLCVACLEAEEGAYL